MNINYILQNVQSVPDFQIALIILLKEEPSDKLESLERSYEVLKYKRMRYNLTTLTNFINEFPHTTHYSVVSIIDADIDLISLQLENLRKNDKIVLP